MVSVPFVVRLRVLGLPEFFVKIAIFAVFTGGGRRRRMSSVGSGWSSPRLVRSGGRSRQRFSVHGSLLQLGQTDAIVITRSFDRIAEQFIGLLDLLELILALFPQGFVLDTIGVMFEDEFPMGRTYGGEVGSLRNSEDGVGIWRYR